MSRIYLSPPDVGDAERDAVVRAIESGWIAPVGPDLSAFEETVAGIGGRAYGVGLSSGTAAIHLALLELGVGRGDDVLVSTFTFAATANAIVYCGARPVFIDSEASTWNLSPDLLEEELAERATDGRLPKAVLAVDLYGQCADYDRIAPICERYGVPLIEDAAEALGATYHGGRAGSFGAVGIFSFNGNKIVTTSGGGMLVTDDQRLAGRIRHLATQAREPVAHYEHTEIGYNYRLSNLLAALGRAQVADLDERIERRRRINRRYREALADRPGVGFQPVTPGHEPNCWLTCVTFDPAMGTTPEDVRVALEAVDIEARPTWKPMHRQPVFEGADARIDGTSDEVFKTGLCLPSGSNLSEEQQDRVIETLVEHLPA
jgi:dTDP-4-amino-4,6-dideoxygalactose transaminase